MAVLIPYFGADQEFRLQEQRLRRRMLEGLWAEDLTKHTREHLGPRRTAYIGKLSRAMNLAKSATDQLAVSYEMPVIVQHEDRDSQQLMADVLAGMYWQGLMKRQNKRIVGMREALVKLSYSDASERVTMELVPADVVDVTTDPNDPMVLREVRHARERTIGDKTAIYYDVHDVETGETIIEDADGVDVTSSFEPDGITVLTDMGGDPIPVWFLYHAEPSDKVWNAQDWCEIFDGARDIATMWNGHMAGVRDGSWAQRVVIDGTPPAAEVDAHGNSIVPASADSLLVIHSKPNQQASVSQWTPPVNPKDMGEAILMYQKTLMATIGLYPGDLQERRAESGIAIQIKRSGQRRYAMSLEPMLRSVDVRVMSSIAKLYNAYYEGGPMLEEDGYTVTYQYLDDPVGDRIAEFEYTMMLVDKHMISPAQAYMRIHPGVTDENTAVGNMLQAAWQSQLIAAGMGRSLIPDEVVDAFEASRNDAADALADFGETLPEPVRALLSRLTSLTDEGNE